MDRFRRGCAEANAAEGGRGFTLLELLVVIAIIGILGAVILDRILRYQEYAEKTAMEQTVGILRSALHLRLAEYLVRGKWQDVEKLVQSNPMDWLAQKPENYLGEHLNPKPGEIPSGNWYFDPKDHTLVYLVRSDRHFVADGGGRKWVRYRVSPVYGDNDKESGSAADKKEINGIRLTLVETYRWF